MKIRKYTNCVYSEQVVSFRNGNHMKAINADTKAIVEYTDVGPGKKGNGICLLAKGKSLVAA